jgi:hypothetical protein
MTEQDVAFAIAQWCSGITQREIAGHFGYTHTALVCLGIKNFIRKYYTDVPLKKVYGEDRIDGYGEDRKPLAKIAFCHFMAQREAA